MMNLGLMLKNTRYKVYLLWAGILFVGFLATNAYQSENINGVWFLFSVIGVGYMLRVMPLQSKIMKAIFINWIAVIVLGLFISFLVFHLQALASLQITLGVFWMILLSLGFIINGFIEKKPQYYFGASIMFIPAIAVMLFSSLIVAQFVMAALGTSLAMIYLVLTMQ